MKGIASTLSKELNVISETAFRIKASQLISQQNKKKFKVFHTNSVIFDALLTQLWGVKTLGYKLTPSFY